MGSLTERLSRNIGLAVLVRQEQGHSISRSSQSNMCPVYGPTDPGAKTSVHKDIQSRKADNPYLMPIRDVAKTQKAVHARTAAGRHWLSQDPAVALPSAAARPH